MADMPYKAYFSLTVRIVIAVALLAGGFAAGQYTDNFLPGAPQTVRDVTDLAEGYHFINPLLMCSDHELVGQTASFSNQLQEKIAATVKKAKDAGAVTDASVLYRDLQNGPRVTVNGDMQSEPASLLKVALALSIHRRIEKDPAFLQKKVVMNIPDQNAGEHFLAPQQAEPGKEYTVEQLLDLSLIDSDNNATDLLIMQLTDQELRESYTDLGIKVPVDNPTTYTMDVGTYASFFRILFNASYLTRQDSEEFLSDLSHSTFTRGIVSGVPAGTTVSHKFGEFANNGVKQLHDCGIVYKPNHPYVICIMTRGNDFEELATTIAQISKTAWDAIPEN